MYIAEKPEHMASTRWKNFEIDQSKVKLRANLVSERPKEVTFEVKVSQGFNVESIHPRGRWGFHLAVSECVNKCAGGHRFTINGDNKKKIWPTSYNREKNILTLKFKRERDNILIPTT